MTPKQKARKKIDHQLEQCGWLVLNHTSMNIFAGLGVAIREFPLKTGYAYYLLYVDEKAWGVIEAKPEGHTLVGVETQSAKYTEGLPKGLPHYHLPLPFAYESTGTNTQFNNGLDPEPPPPRNRWISNRNMSAHKVGQLWKFKISDVDDCIRSGGAADKGDPDNAE